jgi:hypothetical protein
MENKRLSGFLLIAFPVLIQIPFGLLAANYDYPDILRKPPEEILSRFHSGGVPLILTWYAYAMLIGLFLIAILLRNEKNTGVGRLTAFLGVTSALVQMVALLRWTFLVPFLAVNHAQAASPQARAVIESIFSAQHGFLGIGLGEHLGQLTMAAWTVLTCSFELRGARWLQGLGVVSALFLIGGLSESLGAALGIDVGILGQAPVVGFLLWSVWLIGLGVRHFQP